MNVLNKCLGWALLAALALSLGGCSSFHETPKNEQPALLGPVQAEVLLEGAPEFRAAYDEERPGIPFAIPEGTEVLVFFGAWCHDSQREVPRFMRLAEAAGLRARYIGLDLDKRDPAGEAVRHGVLHTPTFVVLRQGQERGRVIERSKKDLRSELVALIQN
ncbi:MAG: thioredoxin family protein [Gammaproteobacteria bacterium]|nr:thioredoxin family protein [Gammaproteobacteria bacterium]